MPLPRIDPSVQHISIGQLRRLAQADLTARTYVVNDGNAPLAVCVPFATFLEMQNALQPAPLALPIPVRAETEGHVGGRPDFTVYQPNPGSPLRGV